MVSLSKLNARSIRVRGIIQTTNPMLARSRKDRNLLTRSFQMPANRKHKLLALIVASLAVGPLIWLQTCTRQIDADMNFSVIEINRSVGWPCLFRSSNRSENLQTQALVSQGVSWNLAAFSANILLMLFVASSFGLFVVYTPNARITIRDIFVLTLIIAILIAAWSSSADWANLTKSYKSGRQLQSPTWANYLVYFAIGAGFATLLRASAQWNKTTRVG